MKKKIEALGTFALLAALLIVSSVLAPASQAGPNGEIKIVNRGVVAPEAKPRPTNGKLAPLANYVARPLQYCNSSYPCGPTMLNATFYAIYWQPSGWSYSANYKHLTSQFLGDVGGTTLYKIATQYYWQYNSYKYYIQNSATFGGYYTDTTAFPSPSHCTHPYSAIGANCLTQADLQNSIIRAMNAKGWTGGTYHMFLIFTPYGVGSCQYSNCTSGVGASYSGFCAYHGSFPVTTNGTSSSVIWADMPYSQDPYHYYTLKVNACDKLPGNTGPGTGHSPNGNVAADSEISTESHEMIEAITDPYPDWNNTGAYLGWTDLALIENGGGEIGDKCSVNVIGDLGWGPQVYDGGLADMYAYNRATGTYDFYNVQKEFSNKAFYASGSTAVGTGCVIAG